MIRNKPVSRTPAGGNKSSRKIVATPEARQRLNQKKPSGGKVIMTPEKRAAINNQKRALDKKTNMDRRRKPKQSY